MMAMAIGIIIIAVAVFEIHMERNAVATMKPNINIRGLVPMVLMILSAIRSCSPHLCIDMAIMNPPIKRKMILSAYGVAASIGLSTPRMGKMTSGMSAVA